MSSIWQNIKRQTKRQKTQFGVVEQASELDPDMVEILELPDQEFKTTTIKMIRALMKKSG